MANVNSERFVLPFHEHVACDACSTATALVWYWLSSSKDTLTFCALHAEENDVELASKGYEIVRDYREKTPEALRAILLSPPPTVSDIVELHLLRASFSA